MHVVVDVDGEPAPHLRPAPAARTPGPVAVAAGALPLARFAVDGERARPAARLLEVAPADGARGGGGLGRLGPAARLAVGSDRWGDGVEANVETDLHRMRLGRAAHAGASLHGVVHGEPPGPPGLEHLVGDGTNLEQRVDHLALLLHPVVAAKVTVRQPVRHADVHGPLVGPDADAGEEARVGRRVVGVEVVGLAPGRVSLDGVGEVVSCIEDWHGYTIARPALSFNASLVRSPAAWKATWPADGRLVGPCVRLIGKRADECGRPRRRLDRHRGRSGGCACRPR